MDECLKELIKENKKKFIVHGIFTVCMYLLFFVFFFGNINYSDNFLLLFSELLFVMIMVYHYVMIYFQDIELARIGCVLSLVITFFVGDTYITNGIQHIYDMFQIDIGWTKYMLIVLMYLICIFQQIVLETVKIRLTKRMFPSLIKEEVPLKKDVKCAASADTDYQQ